MARALRNTYPPYDGAEPYLHLCFSQEDAGRVEPLLAALAQRGVRVWYAEGAAGDAAVLRRRQLRANGAALTVVVVSRAALEDRDVKAAALFRLSKGLSLILLQVDDADYALAMGIPGDVPCIPARKQDGMRAAAEELLRTGGFSYGLIGEPRLPVVGSGGHAGRARTLILLALAAAVVALGLAGMRLGWFSSASLRADDTLPIESPALIVAARAALDGEALTPESAATIEVLRLAELPEDLSELDWFTGLSRLEVPQSEAADAVVLLDGASYDIVLVGG